MSYAIDFEFNGSGNEDMGLISCAIHGPEGTESYWLRDAEGRASLISRLTALKGQLFIGYFISAAEARCFVALGLNPNDYLWRDLSIEWKWLRCEDYRYTYGRRMKDNFPVISVPPKLRVKKKASLDEIEHAKEVNARYLTGVQPKFEGESVVLLELRPEDATLLNCLYFFAIIDPDQYRAAAKEKREVRDELIIKGSEADIAADRDRILAYNASDVADLLTLANVLTQEMEKVGQGMHFRVHQGKSENAKISPEEVAEIQLHLGEVGSRMAVYASRGIPLNKDRFERLLEVVPIVARQEKENWVRSYPMTPIYRVGFNNTTTLSGRKNPLQRSPYGGELIEDDSLLANLIETFCADTGITNYPRTRVSGAPDFSKKVIDRYAVGESILKQLQRHWGNLSTLNTYKADKNGKVGAREYIGADYRQRPMFGPFGSQTARNTAKATSFCFLGPHWLRVMVEPAPGMALIDLDYGSEEFFIAACQSNDPAMKEAYLSNDVYMHFAQSVGMYPAGPLPTEQERDAPEWQEKYGKIRTVAKTCVLAIQYGSGAETIAAAIRDATKDTSVTKKDGEKWLQNFNRAYPTYSRWVEKVRDKYKEGRPLLLGSGWRHGPNNPSVISASNLPIQGEGSSILHRACRNLDNAGYRVIATLHDAITIECPEVDMHRVAEEATKIMIDSATEILGTPGMKVGQPEFVTHGHLWLHSGKAKAAWAKLKEHFA